MTIGTNETFTLNGTLSATNDSQLVTDSNATLRTTVFTADEIQGISDSVYNGSIITFNPTLSNPTIWGKVFTVDTNDYTFKYQIQNTDSSWSDVTELKDAGSYKTVYTKTGNTSVTVEKSFNIAPKAVTDATVTMGGIYTYTGSAIVPTTDNIVVSNGTTTFVNDTDYDFTASNNVNAGTGSVTVTLKGNYSGIATANFTINKAAGSTISGEVTGNYTKNGTNFTFTIVPISGAEYNMDNGAWQDNNIFTDIVSLSNHTFSVRMKEDANHLAGTEKVCIKEAYIEETGTEKAGTELANPNSPQTGDSTPIFLYLILFVLSCGGIAFALKRTKSKRI